MQQQATINLPSGHPVRALTGLAKQISLPGEFAPERFPSFPALERTAVMAFSQPTSLTVPASTTVKMMLARQAAYPLWADRTLTGNVTYGASWQMMDPNAASLSGFALSEGKLSAVFTGTNAAAGVPTVTGASTGGLRWPVIGQDIATGTSPWLYVPIGMSASFVVTSSYGATFVTPGATVNLTMSYDLWTGPNELRTVQTVVALTSGTSGVAAGVSFEENSWIRPRSVSYATSASSDFPGFMVTWVVSTGVASYASGAAQPGTVSIAASSEIQAFLPLTAPIEFANSVLPWSGTRTTAASALVTNVTQVLNKAGTVLAGRVNPSVDNPFIVDSTVVAGLHPAEKAWLPLETGLYTYCPPSTDMAEFWDYSANNTAGGNALFPGPLPVYRLDNNSMVNLAFLTAGGVTEEFAVTASWHLEFRTSSSLFQVALSGMTLETLHQAQLALAAAGFFFHNPDHKSVLEKIIKGVYRIAPLAMGALNAYNPAVAKAISAGHNSIRAALQPRKVAVPQAKMKMAPTNAKSSGIVRGDSARSKKKSGPPAKGGKRR